MSKQMVEEAIKQGIILGLKENNECKKHRIINSYCDYCVIEETTKAKAEGIKESRKEILRVLEPKKEMGVER